jgi:hypothetical protein
MCTENHVCFGRIHGRPLREGANAGQNTPTLSLSIPPSQHCEVYRENRHLSLWHHTMRWPQHVPTYVPWYVHVLQYKFYLKNDLKYKHTGATGKLVGVVLLVPRYQLAMAWPIRNGPFKLPNGTCVLRTRVYVEHTWFSAHMCALFQSDSCDITLYQW